MPTIDRVHEDHRLDVKQEGGLGIHLKAPQPPSATTTISPSPQDVCNSLFPIIMSTPGDFTATTLSVDSDCNLGAINPDVGSSRSEWLLSRFNNAGTGHRGRETEVSCVSGSSSDSMGSSSTVRSRSGLRLAKRERRQKAKDGQEGAEAFAGCELGKSCEDEGVQEIVVPSENGVTHVANQEDMSDSAWATPMLSSAASTPTTTTTNKRSNLRRGKRDLMRSWLDAPVMEVPDTPLCDPNINPQAVSPYLAPTAGSGVAGGAPRTGHSPDRPTTAGAAPLTSSGDGKRSHSITIHCCGSVEGPPDFLSPPFDPLLSPPCGAGEPSTSLSGLVMLMGQNNDTPSESCSSASVRHARPRDTIRSIQAMRVSGSGSENSSMLIPSQYLPPPCHHGLSLPMLAVVANDCKDVSHTSSFHPPPPINLMSTAATSSGRSGSGSVSKWNHPVQASLDAFRSSGSKNGLMLSGIFVDVGCEDAVNGTYSDDDGDTDVINFSHSAVAKISLHPGPKPRNVVTFNADAYNLDAWDADTMGFFALPTEGVTPSNPKKVGISTTEVICSVDSRQSWSPSRAQEMDDCCQTSLSILSAYFDQSRSKPGAGDADPLSEQFHSVASIRNLSPLSSGEGGLLSVDYHQGVEGSPCSPLDGIMTSPTTSPAATTNNDVSSSTAIDRHSRLEYLFEINEAHMESSATSILLGSIDKKEQSMVVGGCSTSSFSNIPTCSTPFAMQSKTSATTRAVSFLTCPKKRAGGISAMSFSNIVSKFVTVDTLVHQATSYTDQLAKSTISGSGKSKLGSQDRWDVDDSSNQQHTDQGTISFLDRTVSQK